MKPLTLLCSYSMFVAELRFEGIAFALISTNPQSIITISASPSLAYVLIKFNDVFQEPIRET